MAERPENIQPPNRLSRKIRKKGGPSAEQAILRALNAAEDLIDNYQGWAVDDLTQLWKAYEESRNGGSPRDIQKCSRSRTGFAARAAASAFS